MPKKITKTKKVKSLSLSRDVDNVIKAEVVKTDSSENTALIISPDQIKLDKNKNIIIGTLNVFINPAKNRYHKFYHREKNPHWHWHIIVDSILAILIIALVAFNLFILFPIGMVIGNKIDLKISVQPTEATSGDVLTYNIDYHNGSKEELKNAKLTVRLPDTFSLDKTSPDNIFLKHSNTFELGDIEAGGNGHVALQGQLLGAVGETQIASANINFNTRNYNIYQQKQAEIKYAVNKSAIDLILETPAKVSNGQNFTMRVKYKNNSNYDLPQLIIENNFSMIGYNLKSKTPFDNNSQWRINDVKAHAEGVVTLEGNFTVASSSTPDAEMKLQSFVPASGQKLLQNNLNQKIAIVNPKFVLELISDQDNLNPGETSNYIIKYYNQEKFDLIDPKLNVKCDGDFVNSGTAVINSPETITAGKAGEIKFFLKLKPEIAVTKAEQKNYSISCFVEANYKMNNDPSLELYSASPKISQKINTKLTLSSFSRYFSPEGDQLGFGPLPPATDQQTRYWIFISAESIYNDASDINITASLPSNIKFTGKTSVTSGDNISYDSDNRIISWKAPKVLAPSTFYPIIGCAFEIELTPQIDQVGKYAPLLQNIKISGTDDFTDEKLSTSIDDITSNLQFDKTNTKSGKVVK